MTSDNQHNIWVAPKTVDVLLRHATRLKRSKDCNLLAHLDTIPDLQSRAKLGPGRSNKGKLAKLAELQQALEELNALTKRAMRQLEEESATALAGRRTPPPPPPPTQPPVPMPQASPTPPTRSRSLRADIPLPPLPTIPPPPVPEDRNQRFREVASRFTSAANRKRFLEVVPHITAPLSGDDDDDEVIRFRGSAAARAHVPQKSLPAVPVPIGLVSLYERR